jgi:hypothetical protein
MKQTQHDRNKAFLESLGWREDKATRASRYTVMTKEGRRLKYFLGSHGAVRRGERSTATVPVILAMPK